MQLCNYQHTSSRNPGDSPLLTEDMLARLFLQEDGPAHMNRRCGTLDTSLQWGRNFLCQLGDEINMRNARSHGQWRITILQSSVHFTGNPFQKVRMSGKICQPHHVGHPLAALPHFPACEGLDDPGRKWGGGQQVGVWFNHETRRCGAQLFGRLKLAACARRGMAVTCREEASVSQRVP